MVGLCAGENRRTLARRGQVIGTPVALNATVARTMSATVVTGNGKDDPMPDVAVLIP
jgi:predicted nucleic acid-binding protein